MCLIILLAVIHFIMIALVGQVATMITGIVGLNYIFTIFHAILTSFSMLIYRGKRWRFFLQITLLTFLIIPTHLGGVAYDFFSKSNLIVVAFIVDLLFNTIYTKFNEFNKIHYWAIFNSVLFWMLNPLFGIIIKSLLFFPQDYLSNLINVVSLLYPLIIIEAIIGGWIGYKLFQRISIMEITD